MNDHECDSTGADSGYCGQEDVPARHLAPYPLLIFFFWWIFFMNTSANRRRY